MEIRLMKIRVQPQRLRVWKALPIGVSLPCEHPRKLLAIFRRQKRPTRPEGFLYPRSPRNAMGKDGLRPFDGHEMRRCLTLGQFLEEPLPTPRIVVHTTVHPYGRG